MPRDKHPLKGASWLNEPKKTPYTGATVELSDSLNNKDKGKAANSIAPFHTMSKPTCGVFFSRATDNKKRKFGIPPSDLVKWRSFAQS